MTKITIGLAFLALNFYTYHYFAHEQVLPPRTSFHRFPNELGDWRCPQREKLDKGSLRVLGVSDYLLCTYVRDDRRDVVGVYVGYHLRQVREGASGGQTIHPPVHCLPGAGWDVIGASNRPLDLPHLPDTPADVNRLIVAKGETRQLVYYWYQSRGRVIASELQKVAYLFWDRARRQRTDGSLVRFTAPIVRGDEAAAEAAVLDLVARVVPLLPEYIPN